MLNRKIDLMSVIADRCLDSSDADEILHALQRAATESGNFAVLKELGELKSIGTDPLADVPEVIPVKSHKVSYIRH